MMTDEEEKNQKDERSYQNILIPEERQLCQSCYVNLKYHQIK